MEKEQERKRQKNLKDDLKELMDLLEEGSEEWKEAKAQLTQVLRDAVSKAAAPVAQAIQAATVFTPGTAYVQVPQVYPSNTNLEDIVVDDDSEVFNESSEFVDGPGGSGDIGDNDIDNDSGSDDNDASSSESATQLKKGSLSVIETNKRIRHKPASASDSKSLAGYASANQCSSSSSFLSTSQYNVKR